MVGASLDHRPITLASMIATSEERILARRTFSGLPDQVRVARHWLAQIIDGFAAVDEVLLACSELAANAIMHSESGRPGGYFTVRLAIRQDIVRVEVLDEGGPWSGGSGGSTYPGAPGARVLAEDVSQCGRGLAIVAAITSVWGIAGDDDGRTAWCEIRSE